jgi:dTDP-4-amino-4,6-dideoxygalactose transaminase
VTLFSLIPPVGEPISRRRSEELLEWPRGWSATYLGSGTQALAFGLSSLRPRQAERNEVVLPAYTCPAVVSAIDFCGLRAVLVDLAPDSPFPAEQALIDAVGPRTAAVVAVNFLGVPPPYRTLAEAAASRGAAVLYDCCQGWPSAQELEGWSAVALSFGRGKPVSVTTGGAWLTRSASPAATQQLAPGRAGSLNSRIRIHNLALHPNVFWWLEKLPFLHVGATRYVELAGLERMSPDGMRLLRTNVTRVANAEPGELQRKLCGASEDELAGSFTFPAQVREVALSRSLLRIPLLARTPRLRDEALAALRGVGVGASALYQHAMPDIAGLEGRFERTVPGADGFARRLLTLPTLKGRSRADCDRVMQFLRMNR